MISKILALFILVGGFSGARAQSPLQCEEAFSLRRNLENYATDLRDFPRNAAIDLRHRTLRHLVLDQNLLIPTNPSQLGTLLSEFEALGSNSLVLHFRKSREHFFYRYSGTEELSSESVQIAIARLGEEIRDTARAKKIVQTFVDLEQHPDIGVQLLSQMLLRMHPLKGKFLVDEQKQMGSYQTAQTYGEDSAQNIRRITWGGTTAFGVDLAFALGVVTASPTPTNLVIAGGGLLASTGTLLFRDKIDQLWRSRQVYLMKWRSFRSDKSFASGLRRFKDLHVGHPTHELDLRFEEAWENWRESALLLANDQNRAEIDTLARRQANLSLLADEIPAWELPNGEKFKDVLREKEILTAARIQELRNSFDRKLRQFDLLEAEVESLKADANALQKEMDEKAASEPSIIRQMRAAQRLIIQTTLSKVLLLEDQLQKNQDQLWAIREAFEKGESSFRGFCKEMSR